MRFADVAGRLLAHSTEEAFKAEDGRGWIGVEQWRVSGPAEVLLTLAREPEGETYVH